MALALVAAACRDGPPAEPLQSLAPPPLSVLTAEAADAGDAARGGPFQVAAAPVHGEPLPRGALRLRLEGEGVRLGAERFAPARPAEAQALAARVRDAVVLLEPDEDTFLAQTSELLEALGRSARAVWLAHPDAPVGYPLVLRDEAAFRAWLDEVAPGKLRVVQRADGFELATSVGKLPGVDPNGPSVPVRGGRQDIATLRKGLGRLRERFTTARDVCFVPSFGTPVAQVARALSGAWRAPGEPWFDALCLVYPAPPPGRPDGG